MLDRIDIHIEVPAMRYADLVSTERGEPSTAIAARVVKAREVQHERFKTNGRRKKRIHANAAMGSKELQKHCALRQDARDLLKMAIAELNFSARAYDRILKVSRTIADLENAGQIQSHHVSEAIQYRTLDRQFW